MAQIQSIATAAEESKLERLFELYDWLNGRIDDSARGRGEHAALDARGHRMVGPPRNLRMCRVLHPRFFDVEEGAEE